MRPRTIREGSVGLFILAGLGLFGALALWVRGVNLGNRGYRIVAEFTNVAGLPEGAVVLYRGVSVGRISAIRAGANKVDVELEIKSAQTIIPKNAIVEIKQSGFIGDPYINITPLVTLAANQGAAANPIANDCSSNLVLCDGDRVNGTTNPTFDDLIAYTVKLTQLITDPKFFGQLQQLTKNSSDAAAGVTVLSKEVTTLSRSAREQLVRLTNSATATTGQVGQAANQVGLTAAQVNNLLVTNRSTLVGTLDNLNQASNQLRVITTRLTPVVDQVGQGQLIQNLEQLSVNAVEASSRLRNLSESVGSSDNLLLLQQTLDSARSTFQNAQKITADLDELTGDPQFRQNVRELVGGLRGLVSSTQQLQQQTELAQVLTPVSIALQNAPANSTLAPAPLPQPSNLRVEQNLRFHRYGTVPAEQGVTAAEVPHQSAPPQ